MALLLNVTAVPRIAVTTRAAGVNLRFGGISQAGRQVRAWPGPARIKLAVGKYSTA